MQPARRSDCPINFALQTFGDAWSLLIVRDLMFTERRTYSDFLRAGEGMATNILAARLRRLEEVGIIGRRGSGRGARYALTTKGLDLMPAMLELVSWSARHDKRTAAPPEFVGRIRSARPALMRQLRDKLEREFEL